MAGRSGEAPTANLSPHNQCPKYVYGFRTGGQRGDTARILTNIGSLSASIATTPDSNYPYLVNTKPCDEEVLLLAMIAVVRAYHLSATELSEITGIDAHDLEKANRSGGVPLACDQRQAALQMLRLFDGLSALFGDDGRAASSWLRTKNLDFDARPIDLLKDKGGIDVVRDYLEAYRSKS